MKKYLFVPLVIAISFAILSSLTTFLATPSNANVSEASYSSLSTLVDNKQVPDKILFTGKMKKTAMDHFYHYLVSASRSMEEHDRITIPTNHMNTLREYLKNHEPVSGLPSIGLSFTGVSIWEYRDLTIFVSDDNSVSFNLGEISFDLQNNLHLDEDSIGDFSHCEFVDGWLLEPSFTLSYWNLGKKVASYHLPELEINEFMVWNGRAVILTSNQIITASQENYQTFDIEETIFSYFITNNGFIFYVTPQHEMYRLRIKSGEIVLKESNVFCIVEGIGHGDGSHVDIKYVTMEGHVNTTRVS